MLSIRVKRFYKKTKRKLEFNGKEPVGFDKTKVECFNCHGRGHFSRDCKTAKNPRNRGRDAGNVGYRGRDNRKRPAREEGEKTLLDKALREKKDLKAKLEKFETSSENLTKLLDSQISENFKTGLGYDSHFNKKEVLDVKEKEVTETVFDNCLSDKENNLANDRFKKGKGFYVVPPPIIGNYMPPKPDLSLVGLDDFIYNFKISETITSSSKDVKYAPETSTAVVEKPKEVRTSAPLIQEWDTKSDNESVFGPKHIPAKINFVKTGNEAYLAGYQEINNGSFVAFGLSRGKITGKASIDESNLWHKRLGHVNFKAINKLVKGNLAEAVNIACYVLIRALVTKLHNKTPYELLNGRLTRLDFMRPFSYPVSILNTLDPLAKFEGKADFLRGIKLKKMLVHEILMAMQDTIELRSTIIFTNAYDDDLDTLTFPVQSVGAEADFNNMESFTITEPKKVAQALDNESWVEAIGTKWVYRNKKDKSGIVVRNKARLVAQGHRQEEWIGYDEVFAPVGRIEAIRIFLAFASFMGFTVYQMDVKSALLYGIIEEEVYIFRFLKGQPKLGLWYPKDSVFDLKAYLDSDYAGANLDRESTIGEMTEGNAKFHQIVDFLTSSSILHALTIHTIVDVKTVVITKSSVRRDLLLTDDNGITCLTNAQIFENLSLISMLAESAVVEGEGLGNPPEFQPTPSLAQSIFESQIPKSSSSPQNTQSPRQTLEGTGFPHTRGPNIPDPSVDVEVIDLEKVKTAQVKVIASLKKRVTKLEQRQSSRISGFHPFRAGTSRRHSLGWRSVSVRNKKYLLVERFMNCLEEQRDGEAMINSIKNGDQPLPHFTQVSIARTSSTEQPPLKDKSMWSDQEKKIQKIDRLARSLLIQGLLNDIYSFIDSNKTAKDLWDALARHMFGSEYGEQDRKTVVLYEYETFKATEGELLLDTYIRYLQNKNLMDINIDAPYNILKKNQGDVNDAMGLKKKTVVVTSDPLALTNEKTKVSKRKEKVVVSSNSKGSDVDDFSELKKITAFLPTRNKSLSSRMTRKLKKRDDEKKQDMSKVKCYNCKKEGYFAKDCKKVKIKDYEYYKTKMLLAKKDKDEQVLLAEDQAWMESSSDSDQEKNSNMVFMAQIEKVLSDSETSSSSVKDKIYEVSYYLSESKTESEYETSKYYDNTTTYGLFVNDNDDQENFS
nr:retrovirus-related Pol polyprotein from transposon TNT 1-94 [Tanacetum cinerariifolium]